MHSLFLIDQSGPLHAHTFLSVAAHHHMFIVYGGGSHWILFLLSRHGPVRLSRPPTPGLQFIQAELDLGLVAARLHHYASDIVWVFFGRVTTHLPLCLARTKGWTRSPLRAHHLYFRTLRLHAHHTPAHHTSHTPRLHLRHHAAYTATTARRTLYAHIRPRHCLTRLFLPPLAVAGGRGCYVPDSTTSHALPATLWTHHRPHANRPHARLPHTLFTVTSPCVYLEFAMPTVLRDSHVTFACTFFVSFSYRTVAGSDTLTPLYIYHLDATLHFAVTRTVHFPTCLRSFAVPSRHAAFVYTRTMPHRVGALA